MKIIPRLFFLLFSIVFLFSTIFTSQTSLFFSSFFLFKEETNLSSNIFIKMIGSENHYFSQSIEDDNESLLSNAIQFATNINLKDVRSLIFDEIPGLSARTPEILVAGEETDFTNLPIESSPPMEELLKDREIYEESLENLEEIDPISPSERHQQNTVFIYHSHSRESFIPHLQDTNSASTAQHKEVNITLVGERLGNRLLEKGIGTKVDKTDIGTILAERGLKYGRSYQVSREIVAEALSQNKNLTYLIDLHRDSAKRNITTTTINGKSYAKLYFVIGESHNNAKQNQKFAIELNNLIKEKYPSLSRGIFYKDKSEGDGVYNQDLSPNALIVEIGGPENTLEEMYNTTDVLAELFAEFYWDKVDALEVTGDSE